MRRSAETRPPEHAELFAGAPRHALPGSGSGGFHAPRRRHRLFPPLCADDRRTCAHGTDVTRIAAADGGGFRVETGRGNWQARNVVQLHTHDYRHSGQLPEGAVLIVGTGQSGGQIAEELLGAGREVHLAVSSCPELPRRYRGQDIFYWLMQLGMHGPEYGLRALTVEQLPSPAARFACNPLVSGADGGHDRGVTEYPGLYAVGLPWLTGQGSSLVAGVGRDAAYIAEHIARRGWRS